MINIESVHQSAVAMVTEVHGSRVQTNEKSLYAA